MCVCIHIYTHTHTHTHTMEYYSAIKRKKTGSFAETWMDLESVIQTEASQKEKHNSRVVIFHVYY